MNMELKCIEIDETDSAPDSAPVSVKRIAFVVWQRPLILIWKQLALGEKAGGTLQRDSYLPN
jgi:hypothetical protein